MDIFLYIFLYIFFLLVHCSVYYSMQYGKAITISRYLIGGFHSVIEHVNLRTAEDLLRVSQRHLERAQFRVIRVPVVIMCRDI